MTFVKLFGKIFFVFFIISYLYVVKYTYSESVDYAINTEAYLEQDFEIDYVAINPETFNDEHRHILEYYEKLEESSINETRVNRLLTGREADDLRYNRNDFKGFDDYWEHYKSSKLTHETSSEGVFIKKINERKKEKRFKRCR